MSALAAKEIIECWDTKIGDLYDPDDAARGFIEVKDRQDQMHKFPPTTVSIGIATNPRRPLNSHWEASEIAAEMKQFAKREPRSSYAIDRRRLGEEDEVEAARTDTGSRA